MAPLAAHEWQQGERIVWGPLALGSMAYVALLPSAVAYGLYNAAVADLGAGRAGQAITLMPLLGAALATALLNEPLLGFHYAGMALILAGIVVSSLRSRPSLLRA
jgi:drug/metabolite transporter (DMT)-like permease